MLEDLNKKNPLTKRLGATDKGGQTATILRAILAFTAEAPIAGWLLKGSKEAMAELSDEADDQVLERRFSDLLAIGEQTNERVRLLSDLARAIFEQTSALQNFLAAHQLPAGREELTEFAKEAALMAYRSSIANELLYADYRGIEGGTRQAHVASLPLDEMYVAPSLTSQRDHIGIDEHARDLMERLDDSGLPSATRLILEQQYATLTREWWHLGATDNARLSLDTVLSSNKHLVVLGSPGVGKSTLSRYLARACALGREALETRLGWGENLIPILLPLARFAEERRQRRDLRLRSYIDDIMLERGGEALRVSVGEAFSDGRVFVMLDGIDEVAEARSRDALVQMVDDFISNNPAIRILVTSRLFGYVRLRGDLPHYILPNFSQFQVRRFVHNWHRINELKQHPHVPDLAKAEADADALLAEIERNPRVSELATNPLMLVIVSLIRHERTRLPEDRVQLYNRAVNTLLETWNYWRSHLSSEAGSVTVPLDRLVRVWSSIAEWMRRERNTGIVHRAELKRKLVEVLERREYVERDSEQTAEIYLQTAADRAGLLEERGPGVFAFWHPTFEEFLAAVELSTPTGTASTRLLPYANDPRWREVILLSVSYIGIIHRDGETAARLIRSIIDEDLPAYEILVHGRCRLAAKCVVDFPTIPSSAADYVIRKLACDVRLHPYESLLQAFAELLGAVPHLRPSEPTIEAIAEIAHVFWENVRVGVARLLSNAAEYSPRARSICTTIIQSRHGRERFYAAVGLLWGGTLGPEVIRGLALDSQTFNAMWNSGTEPIASNKDRLQKALIEALASQDPDLEFSSAQLLLTIGIQKDAALSITQSLLQSPKDWNRAAYLLENHGLLSYDMLPTSLDPNASRVDMLFYLYTSATLRLKFRPDDEEALDILYAIAVHGNEILTPLVLQPIIGKEAYVTRLNQVAKAMTLDTDPYTVYYGANLLHLLDYFDVDVAQKLERKLDEANSATAVSIAWLLHKASVAGERVNDRLRQIFLSSNEDHEPDEGLQALGILRMMNKVDEEILRHSLRWDDRFSAASQHAFEKLLSRDSLGIADMRVLAKDLSPLYPDSYDEHMDLLYSWVTDQLEGRNAR